MRIDRFYRDLCVIGVGMVATIYLSQSGFLPATLARLEPQAALGSFIAGLFFTSAFTIAPASAVLAGLSGVAPQLLVAFWGALGAMFGDALLFLFVRDVFAEDARRFLKRHHLKLFTIPHFGFLRWLYPIMGALIIASPLPDELGLALLGLTKTKLRVLLPVAFVMNFLGVLLIAGIAQSF
jgi:membrane protein DedA with SNARE-associated domain